MSARKGKNLKRVKYLLKLLEDTTTNTSMRRAEHEVRHCKVAGGLTSTLAQRSST